ncbi:MAG: hypothetical protein KatS3mg077_1013 [Candidatus Binatia bacterium]|nr:MAG: hypothetical protein KatS3mg077_1013 [Candidatus Binatia bacterium]
MTNCSRIRIALVIGQLTRGGAEGQLAQLAARLDPRRFEPFVYVLSTAREPWGTWLEQRHVPCTTIAGRIAVRVWQLAQRFIRDEIDLVHSWLYLANPIAALAALLARRPLVCAARNCKVNGTVSRWGNILAFRRSRRIITNSTDVAEYIVRHYAAPRARICVVPNGIDTSRFCPPAKPFGGSPIVMTAGRLVPQKNHEMFLRAAKELGVRFPQARFAIAGEGPLRRALEALAGEFGLAERVAFLGERGDLEVVLREAHVFWLTSRWEGMPNVLLEAMACGLPVVATDVGGCREVIGDAGGGVVVPADSIQGFVDATAKWLGSPMDYERASRAARKRAEEFSIERIVARMEDLYDEVVRR